MDTFKECCVKLRRLDHTLPEISKITGKPKSSVYLHIKNIPLSSQKQKLIKNGYALRVSALSAARKGKSSRKFKKIIRWDEDLVNLISHFIFDGEIKYSGCIYNNRNQTLLDKVKSLMRRLYEFEPIDYLDPFTGVKRISYFNVALAEYVKEKSVELLKKIAYLPRPLKRAFLLAFFDDEGCVDFRKQKHMRRVRGYQKNIGVLILVKKILNEFGIFSLIHKPNEIVITRKINLKKFQKEIGFSPGVCINGNRSNSIWKKSLEKRYLLDQAIKSFKS